MIFRIVMYVVGLVLKIEGGLLMFPALVGLIYKENNVLVYLLTALASFLIGTLMSLKKPVNSKIYAKEGFLCVGFSWVFMSLFGAVPFVVTGEIPNYIDALFETVSGFTTTGASVISDLTTISRASLFWRSFTHFIGGMGVCVFMMAIVPLMGGRSMNIMKAESTGPSVGKLVPHAKDTAKILYLIYIGLVALEVIFLLFGKMSLFEALTISFGTIGTGGFGLLGDSIASYGAYNQIVITVFMFLAGMNFTVYFLLISGKIKEIFKLEEVRWYTIIMAAAIGIICFDIRGIYASAGETVRHAAFQVASIMTTTGFATVDFDSWPQLSKTVLVAVMFIGGCAGSTCGGMKVSRFVIWFKSIKKELSTLVHPREIKKIKMDGHMVAHETVRSANSFLAVYVVVVVFSVLLIAPDEFDFTTNFTAVVATLNDIGPGLAGVGPARNYAAYSAFSKVVLMFDMLAGRLELFPMLFLILPSTYRRK